RGTDGGGFRAEGGDVAGVDLAPAGAFVSDGRGAGKSTLQLVEADVPAGTVASRLADLVEGVDEGEDAAGALRRQLEAQVVVAPSQLEERRRLEGENLAIEVVLRMVGHVEPQWRPRCHGALDLVGEPGSEVLGLGEGAPNRGLGVVEVADEAELPAVAGGGELCIHGLTLPVGYIAGKARRNRTARSHRPSTSGAPSKKWSALGTVWSSTMAPACWSASASRWLCAHGTHVSASPCCSRNGGASART